jgi:hypothetical protein
MKKLYLTGALLASALAIAGCNRGAGNSAANATNAAAPAAPAENAAGEEGGNSAASGEGGGAAAGQAQQNFTLVNNTGHVVVTLNVSPNSEDEWGPDILGVDTLANGQSAQISFQRGESQCSWDIKATYDDGDTTDARGVDLCHIATVTLTPGE